jgi:hypothetical protein
MIGTVYTVLGLIVQSAATALDVWPVAAAFDVWDTVGITVVSRRAVIRANTRWRMVFM